MVQSTGFKDDSGKVCKLKKSLYGLKQAPRRWYEKFDLFLKKFGLKPTDYDSCVYTTTDGNLHLALYVDDGLVIGRSMITIERLLTEL